MLQHTEGAIIKDKHGLWGARALRASKQQDKEPTQKQTCRRELGSERRETARSLSAVHQGLWELFGV
jgi:hypothetical protein